MVEKSQDIDLLSNAYYKYSINQSHDNLRRLQELTGTRNLSAALRVTQAMILKSRQIKPLTSLQQALSRLRRVHLIQGRMFSEELQQLDYSLKQRLRHLEHRDMRKMQSHIFHLCCKALRGSVLEGQSKIIGPCMMELTSSKDFTQDTQELCKLSTFENRSEKLFFLTQCLVDLHDKYIPRSATETQLWQFLILCLVIVEHPAMLLDLEDAQKGLNAEECDLQQAHWMKRITIAVANIYDEALPLLKTNPPRELQNLKTNAVFKARTRSRQQVR